MTFRGGYMNEQENLFVCHDGTNVCDHNVRLTLKKCLLNLGLNSKCYNTQSFCIGMASDMCKKGHSIEHIKRAGHWRSNAVYKYLRN